MNPLLKWAATKGLKHINDVAVLLLLLEHGPQRLSKLAELIGQSPTTLTNIADSLEHRGLAMRERVKDRRGWRLALTEETLASLEQLTSVPA